MIIQLNVDISSHIQMVEEFYPYPNYMDMNLNVDFGYQPTGLDNTARHTRSLLLLLVSSSSTCWWAALVVVRRRLIRGTVLLGHELVHTVPD